MALDDVDVVVEAIGRFLGQSRQQHGLVSSQARRA
jgi:hypothetical protein